MRSIQKQILWSVRLQWGLAITTAVVCLGFMLFSYLPQTRRQAWLDEQVVKSRKELAECRGQTKVLPTVEADVQKLSERLKDFKALPNQMDMHVFLKDITNAQQMSSLKNPNTVAGDTVRGDRLDRKPVTFSFEGDFVNVYTFLRNAEEIPRLTRVPKFSIKRKDPQGQVKVQMTMDIFSMVE